MRQSRRSARTAEFFKARRAAKRAAVVIDRETDMAWFAEHGLVRRASVYGWEARHRSSAGGSIIHAALHTLLKS